MAEGVIDTGDSLSLGLRRQESALWTEVYRSEGYVNNAVITRFKGRYYCRRQTIVLSFPFCKPLKHIINTLRMMTIMTT